MERCKEIEKSLIKKYRKTIWNRFVMGIKEYKMINDGDKIAVCISGGKDSMIMAKCLQHLQEYSPTHFELEYIVMDPGYSSENRCKIEENAQLLNIPIKVFETDIFDSVDNMGGSPCYVCARMRRGHLYKNAQSLGCNKIALGHHFDDVIETVLMGMLYGGQVQTMMPKLHSTNYQGMQLIRPLYMVKERDILSWVHYNRLHFIQCACHFTQLYEQQHSTNEELASKRAEMKLLIENFRKINPNIEYNIFNSVCNVNLDTIISYRKGTDHTSFMDTYQD